MARAPSAVNTTCLPRIYPDSHGFLRLIIPRDARDLLIGPDIFSRTSVNWDMDLKIMRAHYSFLGMCVTGVYNSDEFPTAVAFGHTLAAAARGDFLCVLCTVFASFAVKSFNRKDRKGFAKFAEKSQPRGCRWKRPRLPVLTRTIGKETTAGIVPPAVSFPPIAKAKSQELGARSCFSPTNSAGRSPISGSPLPTGVTTSVSTAAPGTRARSTATCPLPTTCAWRECWSNWESRKSV